MLTDIISTYGERLVIAVVGVGLAFIALIVVLWLVRRRGGPAPFLKGGRNRQPRLQVLDATAVDARRRLVLVRRDNVEHLIMIGGPTDIVVESGIGAIPFVTDITNHDQERLSNAQTAPAPMDRPEPVLTAPAPAIAQDKPIPVVQPTATIVKPEPVKEPTKTEAPQAPAAPIAPKRIEPQPSPGITLEPAKPAAADAPVSAAIVTAPTVAKPIAATPAATQAPTASAEPVKPSSPLTTSAMRPRAAVTPVAAPVEAQPASNPPSPALTATMASATTAAAVAAPIASTASSGFENPLANISKNEATESHNVADIFDAARERVLPDLAIAETQKAADLSFEDSFSAELRDDFESFLNAEIEKNAMPSDSNRAAQAFNLDSFNTTNGAPITGASVDMDAQKEMARIFGEMAVKRD